MRRLLALCALVLASSSPPPVPRWGEAVARLEALGAVSDSPPALARTYLSPAHFRAATLLGAWMVDAGLRTWQDVAGNVHGVSEGSDAGCRALLLGSHYDTVVDAGRFVSPKPPQAAG